MINLEFSIVVLIIWLIILAIMYSSSQSCKVYKHGVYGDTAEEFMKSLKTMALSAYRRANRNLKRTDLKMIKVSKLVQGATNNCYKVDLAPNACVFVRVQGNGSILSMSKDHELVLLRKCGSMGITPKLYAIFENGYVAEFLNGDCISVPMMANPVFSTNIARLTAKWHSIRLKSSERKHVNANVWNTIDKYILLARKNCVDPVFLSDIEKEIAITKSDIQKHSKEDEFLLCHNDLNHGNILYVEQKDSLVFVDLEFAGLNYRNFDLANHFCEWAGMELNYDLCPTREQQISWLSTYVDAFYGKSLKHKDLIVNRLYVETTKWMQVSHLFWTLWGSVQTKISNVDFDYVNYTYTRWRQYHKMKNSVLNLTYNKSVL